MIPKSIYFSYDNNILELSNSFKYSSNQKLLDDYCNSATQCYRCNNHQIRIIDIGGIPSCFNCCSDSNYIASFIDDNTIYEGVSFISSMGETVQFNEDTNQIINDGEVYSIGEVGPNVFSNIYWHDDNDELKIFRYGEKNCSEP